MKVMDITRYKKRGSAIMDTIEEICSQMEAPYPEVLLVTKTQLERLRHQRKVNRMYASTQYYLITDFGIMEVVVKK